MTKQLRIFFTTSCLNTAMVAIHARKEAAISTDVLVIDRIPVRRSTVKVIEQTACLHEFDAVIDLSEVKKDSRGLEASASKKLTRRLKSKPGFKQIYDFLYSRLRDNQKKEWATLLMQHIPALEEDYEHVLIFSQPMIRLLPAARSLLPKANVTFLEHGLGDNLDIAGKMKKGDSFLALFGDELSQSNTKALRLDFSQYSEDFLGALPEAERAFDGLPEGNWTILATQPLEGFEVPVVYWDYFVSLMQGHLNEDCTVLIKPHPSQSMDVCNHIQNALKQQGINSIIWDNDAAKFINLELLFALEAKRFESVFSPFSSSVFYLSKLFPRSETKFYYSIKSLDGFTSKTPKHIRDRWEELGKKIDGVFGLDAIDIT